MTRHVVLSRVWPRQISGVCHTKTQKVGLWSWRWSSVSRWVCVSTSNLPFLISSCWFISCLWSHSSFTCMQCHSPLVVFDRPALMKWKAIEAVTGSALKLALTKLSVMAWSHLGFVICGSKHLGSFSAHSCMLKIQETQTPKCVSSSRCCEQDRWRFVLLEFEGVLLESASIMLTLFRDSQAHLCPFSWEFRNLS